MTAGTQARIVIVGAALAGVRTAEALRRSGHGGEIVLVGSESHFPPYDRPPLSKTYLARPDEPAPLLRVDPELNAVLRLGATAVGADLTARTITLDTGESLDFDYLVVASGARARQLPDAHYAGAHVLRTVEDASELRSACHARDSAVAILGAGFVGCELAATLRSLGREVALLDPEPVPLRAALGDELGGWLAALHRRHGVHVGLGAVPTIRSGDRRTVEAGGVSYPADVLVTAIGAAPNIEWLAGSGLVLDSGVRCDEFGFALGAEQVLAVGDVARWQHPLLGSAIRVEHWTHAVGQARAAAANVVAHQLGEPLAAHADLPYFWSDQYDWKLQFVGATATDAELVAGSPSENSFVMTFREGGRLTGVLTVNRPADLVRWRRALTAEFMADRIGSERDIATERMLF